MPAARGDDGQQRGRREQRIFGREHGADGHQRHQWRRDGDWHDRDGDQRFVRDQRFIRDRLIFDASTSQWLSFIAWGAGS